jgi:hypothetical protein
MKAFIAFTVMLLAASAFELSTDVTEDMVIELVDALDNNEATKEVMASGSVEVVALPDHFLGVDYSHDANWKSHAKHINFMKCKLGTVPKACAALKSAFTAKPRSVCSYIDLKPMKGDSKYGKYSSWGKCVWCFDRLEVGNGAKYHGWDKSPAATFFLGYML